MCGHHRVGAAGLNDICKWFKLRLRPSVRHIYKTEMRIILRAAVSRKMFQRCEHPALMMRLDNLERIVGHDLWIGGEAAPEFPDDRIIGIDVQVNHRREIEINAKICKCGSCLCRGLAR